MGACGSMGKAQHQLTCEVCTIIHITQARHECMEKVSSRLRHKVQKVELYDKTAPCSRQRPCCTELGWASSISKAHLSQGIRETAQDS